MNYHSNRDTIIVMKMVGDKILLQDQRLSVSAGDDIHSEKPKREDIKTPNLFDLVKINKLDKEKIVKRGPNKPVPKRIDNPFIRNSNLGIKLTDRG